jgi:two-component sensor histidine kinase
MIIRTFEDQKLTHKYDLNCNIFYVCLSPALSITIFFLSGALSFLPAQSLRKIDSLKIALLTSPADSLQIEYNWEIGNDYWLYHEDSIDLAKKYALKSIELANTQSNTKWLINGYNLLGKIFNLTEELDSALWSFDRGMEACLSQEDSMRFMMLFDNKANIYVDKGMYTEALVMKQEASEYFQHYADSNTVSSSYFGLGYIYLIKGDNVPAKSYFYKSLSYADDWPLIESEIYGNLAMIYTDLENPDSAEICFRLSAVLSKEIPSIYNLNLYEFALFKDKQGEADSALYYLEYVLAAEGQGMDLEQYQVMQLDYARILAQQGRKNIAKRYYDLAHNLVEKSQNPKHLQKLYESKAYVYESLGDHATALAAYKKYRQLQDSIQNSENQQKFKEIETRYETEKKEQEIQYLNAEKEVSAIKLASSRRWVIGLTLGLAALALLSFFLFWQQRKITQQRDQINVALKEKEILLREIHHRVKNNLQFISSLLGLQTEHVSDETALGALQEGQDRVHSMALIHQDLYREDNLTGVDMKNYFTKLVRGLFDSYNIRRNQITLDLDIEELNLDVDSVIPIGLIVNELVSNSLKYAFPGGQKGKISVTLQEQNNQLVLKVSDDGVGMSTDDSGKLGTSFGYRLIEVLCEQMKGILKIDGAAGTTVMLKINKYEKQLGKQL